MAKTYVYLVDSHLDMTDRKKIVKLGLNLEGYCDLGFTEGYAISGTLVGLKAFIENYIGVEIVDDFLFEEDLFDDISSDADWKHIDFKSWELLRSFESKKSLKEGKDSDFFNGIAKKYHFSKDEKTRYKDKTYISSIAVLFDRINNAIKTYGQNSDEEYNALNDCWEVISSAKQNGFNVDYDEDRWNKIAGLPNYH